MLVTAAVFQSAIGPYVVVAVVGSVSHAVTAVPMFVLVMAVCAATCAGRNSSSATPTRRCDRHARAHLHRKRRRRAAPPCDTLRGGMCCIIVQRRTPSCNPQGCPAPVLQRPPEHRKLAATHRYCCAEYAGLHCELQRFRGAKLQHGATCCTTYIEAATTGLSRAMVTPSQILVTAAAAVAHTASMKSKQSRAQPAVGISFCPARAGTRACVVKLCAASLAACANVRANGRLPCPTRHGIQWRVLPACADGGRLAALSSPTVVSVSGWDDNETAARGSHSQQRDCR